MQGVPSERSHPVLLLLNFKLFEPDRETSFHFRLVLILNKEPIHAGFLLLFLVNQGLDSEILAVDLCGDLCESFAFSARVEVVILLVLDHVAVPHLRVLGH